MESCTIYEGIVISTELNCLHISIPKWTADYRRKNYNFILSISNYQMGDEAIQVGDYVQVNGKIITKLDKGLEARLIRWNKQTDTNRDLIEANICFLPLFYSLYPPKAKEKNLVLAYSNEFGYLPITKANNYKKHCIYKGTAIYYLNKKDSEKEIETNYQTGWFIFNNAKPVDIAYLKRNFIFFTGIVLDSSLADVFVIYCKQLGNKPIYLRKEISKGIALGDWIKFIYCEVDEAEKSDEQKKIYPNHEDEMNYYPGRRIALHPTKIEIPLLNIAVINERQIEIIHKLEIPGNSTHMGIYDLPHLGEIYDENGIITLKMEHRKILLTIYSRILNYNKIEFIIMHSTEIVTEKQYSTNSFLDSILNQPKPEFQPKNVKPINSTINEMAAIENVIKPERPINSISFNGIIVEKNQNYTVAFANDPALEGHIIHLNPYHINPLPNLGDWVEIIMVDKRKNRSFRPNYELWGSKIKTPVHETSLGSNNTIKLRVPLKVRDGAFFNKDLGIVNDIKRRLNIPEGYEKRTVIAWCSKLSIEDCKYFNAYWEIAETPDAEWNEIYFPEVSRGEFVTKKSTECIGYIGSRYRTEQIEQQKKKQLLVTTSKQSTAKLTKIDLFNIVHEDSNSGQSSRENKVVTTSDKKKSCKKNVLFTMDLDNENDCDNKEALTTQQENLIVDFPQFSQSALSDSTHQTESQDFEFLGVIASFDANSNGFYVYTNQLEAEVFLDSPKGTVEQGTWISFNLMQNSARLTVNQFTLLSSGPCMVRAENNSINMLVIAHIPADYCGQQEIRTEYVPMVYDINHVIKEAHRGQTLRLKIRRGRFKGCPYKWTILEVRQCV